MSSREKVDPAKTYVLDETAITKATSIEELADLAMHEPGYAPDAEETKDDRESEESAHRTNGFGRR